MKPVGTRLAPDVGACGARGPTVPEPSVAPLLREIYEASPPAVQVSLLSRLVAKLYEGAPARERRRLLEHFLRPLGLLSLAAVANGAFARICLARNGPDLGIRLADIEQVQTVDLIALVDYVQQASVQSIDGLSGILSASPLLMGSAAAVVLMQILLQRARVRRTVGNDFDP